MAVTETSKQSYQTLDQLGRWQKIVYEQIKTMEEKAFDSSELPSRRDVAYQLGKENGFISARSRELMKAGFVRVHGMKRDKLTGKAVETLCTADPNDKVLIDLFKAEKQEPDNQPKAVSWLYD